MWSAVIFLAVSILLTATKGQNDFDAIKGCKQYTSTQGYNYPHPYFAIDQFKYVPEIELAGFKMRTIKLAVLGSNDGVIRLAPIDQPYKNTVMDEIVLSGWGNTRNVVRRYVRSGPNRVSRNVILLNDLSGGILSPYKLLVFTLSIVNNHMVILSRNGVPFLQYTDDQVAPKYISFCNWNNPVSVFYDCPPPPPPPPSSTIAPTPTSTVAPAPTSTVDPAPTSTVAPAPTSTVDPAPTSSVAPAPTSTVDPAPTSSVAPAPTSTVDPAPTSTVDPAPTSSVAPAPTSTVDPAPTSSVAPAPTSTVDPAPTSTVDPAPTSSVAPAPTSTVDPASTSSVAPAPTSTVDPDLTSTADGG